MSAIAVHVIGCGAVGTGMIAFAEEAIAKDAAKTEVRFRGNEVRFGKLSFMGWDGAERTVVSGLISHQHCISSEGNRLTLASSRSADPICKMMQKNFRKKISRSEQARSSPNRFHFHRNHSGLI